MILSFGCVLCLIELWIPLMWVWLRYFTQRVHLCFYILICSWVILLSVLKHINIGVFIHLPMFYWFIKIWRCRLIHKLGLYTSCNIPPLNNHRLWTWNFVHLIRYYKSSYSILITITLNHRLWSRSMLHPLIQMNNQLHFSPCRSSFGIILSLKTPSPYIPSYHFLW